MALLPSHNRMSWTSKKNSQNFKESFKSEHRMKNAIVRGMVVCSTPRISNDIQQSFFRKHTRGNCINDAEYDVHIAMLSDKKMTTSSTHREALFSRLSPHLVIRSLRKTRRKSMAANALRHLSQLLEGLQARRILAALKSFQASSCVRTRSMLELVTCASTLRLRHFLHVSTSCCA